MHEYIATNSLTLDNFTVTAQTVNEAYNLLQDKLYIGYDWIIQLKKGV